MLFINLYATVGNFLKAKIKIYCLVIMSQNIHLALGNLVFNQIKITFHSGKEHSMYSQGYKTKCCK